MLPAAAFLLAQATGRLYVHVADAKTGKPFSGWTVQITTPEGDRKALTDRKGEAIFLTVSGGIARIDVLRGGLLAVCPEVVDVSPDESTVVNVHARKSLGRVGNCDPMRAKMDVHPGETSDVYDIF